MGRRKKVTLRDVAKESGVSLGTVVRTFNGGTVGDDLAKKVHQAAKHLGYDESHTSSGRPWGVIVPALDNPFFPIVVRQVQSAAEELGYGIIATSSNEDLETEAQAIEMMKGVGVSALVIVPVSEKETDLSTFHKLRRTSPIIAFDRRPMRGTNDVVLIENQQGAYEATKLLIDRGYQKIAAVLTNLNATSGRERQIGYVQAMLEAGRPIDPEIVQVAEKGSAEEAEAAVHKLLTLEEPVDAMFVGNGLMIEGAKRAAKKLNSNAVVVGFDDPFWASDIATIAQPMEAIGQAVADHIVAALRGKPITGEIRLPVELVRSDLVPKKLISSRKR